MTKRLSGPLAEVPCEKTRGDKLEVLLIAQANKKVW